MADPNSQATIAAVLSLVDQQDQVIAPEILPPPNGASLRASEAWYATLKEIHLENEGERRLLEAIVAVITQYDLVENRWVAEGCPVSSKGSMGQDVEAPALGTMQKLRTQEAALWKQLNLPTDNVKGARRPGRPTRSEGGGRWGGGA